MNEAERIQTLKRAAWDAGDLELFEFYNGIEFELARLRMVARVVGMFYTRGGIDDEGWNTLFEVLSDAGAIPEEHADDGPDPADMYGQ